MCLHSLKIYNRFLEIDEFDELDSRFPFLYHFISNSYIYRTDYTNRVILPNHDIYAEFIADASLYSTSIYGTHLFNFSNPIWYEYEIEICSATSTFGIDFFNSSNANVYTYPLTNNFFDTTFSGLAFGVENQYLKYKCGSTVQTTSITVPLNQRKFISFLYTSTEVKFYYDKQLIATVLRSVDDSMFNYCENNFPNLTYISIFNLGGTTNNKVHFAVRHSFERTDLGTADNSILF